MGVTSDAFKLEIAPPASKAAAASSEQKNLLKSSMLQVNFDNDGTLSNVSTADLIA